MSRSEREQAARHRQLANALLWDVLLQTARTIQVEILRGEGTRRLPLVMFRGQLFAVWAGNPWAPTCRLWSRKQALVIWADGQVRDGKTNTVLGHRDELAAVLASKPRAEPLDS